MTAFWGHPREKTHGRLVERCFSFQLKRRHRKTKTTTWRIFKSKKDVSLWTHTMMAEMCQRKCYWNAVKSHQFMLILCQIVFCLCLCDIQTPIEQLMSLNLNRPEGHLFLSSGQAMHVMTENQRRPNSSLWHFCPGKTRVSHKATSSERVSFRL